MIKHEKDCALWREVESVVSALRAQGLAVRAQLFSEQYELSHQCGSPYDSATVYAQLEEGEYGWPTPILAGHIRNQTLDQALNEARQRLHEAKTGTGWNQCNHCGQYFHPQHAPDPSRHTSGGAGR